MCALDCADLTRNTAEVASIVELHQEMGRILTKRIEHAICLLYQHNFEGAAQAAFRVQNCGRHESAMDLAGNQFRNDAYCTCVRAAAAICKAHVYASSDALDIDKAKAYVGRAEGLLKEATELLDVPGGLLGLSKFGDQVKAGEGNVKVKGLFYTAIRLAELFECVRDMVPNDSTQAQSS